MTRRLFDLRHSLILVFGLLTLALAATPPVQAQCGVQPFCLRLMCGDCDLNNVIDSSDVAAVANHPSIPITGPRRLGCDVNSDGRIDIRDALFIQQFITFGAPPAGWGCPRCGDSSGTASPPFTPDGMVDTNDVNALLWTSFGWPGSVIDSGFAAIDVDGDGLATVASDNTQLLASCNFGPPANPFPVCGQCGDCDLDGDVDAADSARASSAGVGNIVLNGLEFGLCDIDLDRAITVIDSLLIAQGNTGTCLARNAPQC